jgi:hypothetical protein
VPNLIFPPCRCLDLQRKEGLMPIREKIGGKLLVGGGSGGAEETNGVGGAMGGCGGVRGGARDF